MQEGVQGVGDGGVIEEGPQETCHSSAPLINPI